LKKLAEKVASFRDPDGVAQNKGGLSSELADARKNVIGKPFVDKGLANKEQFE
jgi:hypothetical protein